jgi:hypothetical protein
MQEEPQRASKGSPESRGPDRSRRLSFSLRLGWHPYLDERAVHPATAAWFGVGCYAGGGFLRHRMVFPIHDHEGQLVAYAGRSLDGGEPRYLFPPASTSRRWSLISIVQCGNQRGARWWWKDSLTACECIKLGTATWWLCWD